MAHPMDAMTQVSLESAYKVHRWWEFSDKEALLAEVGPRIRGMASSYVLPVTARLIDRLPKLEIVSNYGVGFEHIDLEHARRRGVFVTNTPDVLTEDVAGLAVALWLAVYRQVVGGDRFVREGKWAHGFYPLTKSTQGRRVGIFGMGRIGQAIAKRMEPFGAQIAYHQPRPKSGLAYRFEPDLVALAGWAEILFVASPGGEATRNAIDRSVLDALGPDGTLVNIARGSIVDEPALIAALQEGRLGGAGLDVFAAEPSVPSALLGLENVVLLPHVGSGTVETRRAMGQLMVDNLAAHFAGRPLVTPVP